MSYAHLMSQKRTLALLVTNVFLFVKTLVMWKFVAVVSIDESDFMCYYVSYYYHVIKQYTIVS